jgi:hypothetical protein
MKKYEKIIVLMSILPAFAACDSGNQSHHESGADSEHAESSVTYNANRGLKIPDETAKAIQLKVADVVEGRVASEFRFSAQVFERSGGVRRAALAKSGEDLALASADLGQEDAKQLKQGQEVKAQTDTGAILPARVVELYAHNEKSDAHVDVTIGIDDAAAQLRPGSFVKISAPIGGVSDVVSVPRSALLQTSEGKFVYTVSGDEFVRTAVKVGVANEQDVEITDGLYAGDKVVVNPVMTLWMAELQSIRGGKACADGH